MKYFIFRDLTLFMFAWLGLNLVIGLSVFFVYPALIIYNYLNGMPKVFNIVNIVILIGHILALFYGNIEIHLSPNALVVLITSLIFAFMIIILLKPHELLMGDLRVYSNKVIPFGVMLIVVAVGIITSENGAIYIGEVEPANKVLLRISTLTSLLVIMDVYYALMSITIEKLIMLEKSEQRYNVKNSKIASHRVEGLVFFRVINDDDEEFHGVIGKLPIGVPVNFLFATYGVSKNILSNNVYEFTEDLELISGLLKLE